MSCGGCYNYITVEYLRLSIAFGELVRVLLFYAEMGKLTLGAELGLLGYQTGLANVLSST
ncbi:MAG: hypothetical protein KKE08_06525 [Gammaproteobacteria bacterium]|nr:hypothetical protein [Gammaproteobacteria bacterium]MBU2182663.1 hypothetical protein [Gammaproteobacteria bacterium]MBU2206590.1 hypothetical protein [Gammaproteobacteria bacterium]